MAPLLRRDEAPSRFFSHLLTSSTRIRISTVGILEMQPAVANSNSKPASQPCNEGLLSDWHRVTWLAGYYYISNRRPLKTHCSHADVRQLGYVIM